MELRLANTQVDRASQSLSLSGSNSARKSCKSLTTLASEFSASGTTKLLPGNREATGADRDTLVVDLEADVKGASVAKDSMLSDPEMLSHDIPDVDEPCDDESDMIFASSQTYPERAIHRSTIIPRASSDSDVCSAYSTS